MARDYEKEYREYQGRPDQIRRRSQRNAARRKLEKAGRVHKGDGMDVHHKDHNTGNNRLSNLSVMTKSKNRALH